MFDSLVKMLDAPQNQTLAQVSKKDFERWNRTNLFDRLQGVPLGRSFINTFGIQDYILEYGKDDALCHDYIIKYYVRDQ